ncbi:SPARC/osteonectin, cwcv and kazal like domains proteoglycan 1, partial [Chelydra serpentina]
AGRSRLGRSPRLSPTHQAGSEQRLHAERPGWPQVEGRHPEILPSHHNSGNFLDNDKWLSTVSQYEKDKYWNKFRDEVEDDYFRNWNPNKPFDQALDPSKDPCLKVKCS